MACNWNTVLSCRFTARTVLNSYLTEGPGSLAELRVVLDDIIGDSLRSLHTIT